LINLIFQGWFTGREDSGHAYFLNGDRYVGGWSDGKSMSGNGTYFWKNGDRYVGEFVDNLKEGQV